MKQGEGFGFPLAGMAASASSVGGLGLADVVLCAGSWRRNTKEQFETPWEDQTASKEDLGIKDKYDEELYKFAFDPDSLGKNPDIVLPLSTPNTASFEQNSFRVFFETSFEAFMFATFV